LDSNLFIYVKYSGRETSALERTVAVVGAVLAEQSQTESGRVGQRHVGTGYGSKGQAGRQEQGEEGFAQQREGQRSEQVSRNEVKV
jgi:hypothetical protein